MPCTNYVNAYIKSILCLKSNYENVFNLRNTYINYMHVKSGGFRTNLVYALDAHTQNFQFSSIANKQTIYDKFCL